MPYSSYSVAACGALSFRQLAVAAVQVPALLCLEAMLWAVDFLTFPLRLLAAADRERKLDWLVGEMQGQMERVVRENRDLEQRLRAALKEQAAMEEKSMWDKAATAAAVAGQVVVGGDKAGADKCAPKAFDVCIEDDEDETDVAVFESAASSPSSIAAAEREVRLMEVTARRRSLLSLGMSLAVSGIVWSADAPCLPLLAGLLTVVGMSMCSVARLFRAPAPARAHRGGLVSATPAAADGAVALLSLNWFLLGVLTYPMLPGVARAVVPCAARLAGPGLILGTGSWDRWGPVAVQTKADRRLNIES